MPKYKLQKITKLSAEKQLENLKDYKNTLKKHLSKNRLTNILKMIDSIEEELVMSPASPGDHGSYLGGLLEHLNDTIQYILILKTVMQKMGAKNMPSDESCVFVAAMHDLGKIGSKGAPNYIVEDSEWHREHMNRNFKIDFDRPTILHHADCSLYLLQKYGVVTTQEEYQAIRIHDGSGAKINSWSPYNWNVESLSHLLRVADYCSVVFRNKKEGN